MLIIRLTRRGRRNDPSFRLVVTESSNPVRGKFLEELGNYNSRQKTKALDKERILYWMSQGAKLSKTVNNLLVGEGVIQGKKVKAWRPKKKKGTSEVAKTEVNKKEKAQEAPAGMSSGATAEKSEVAETKKDVVPAEPEKQAE